MDVTQKVHVMHGRDHLPGGSDPIPGLGAAGFSETVLGIGELVPNSLLGYWRLGESAGPFADISGQSSSSPLTVVAGTNPLTTHVTGALTASQDDGAVEFAGVGHATTGDYLHTTANGSRFTLASGNMSVACWFKPVHNATSYYGGILGQFIAGGSTSRGWGLHILSDTLVPSWDRFQDGGVQKSLTGPSLADGEWAFLVGTYSSSDGMKFYVNGVLVDSDTTTFSLSSDTTGVTVGWLRSLAAFDAYTQGTVDEATVWGIELTAAQVLDLYNSGAVSGLSSNPSGPAGGDLTGTYPNPTLSLIGSATGPVGGVATIPVITIDAKGRVTALTSVGFSPTGASTWWFPLFDSDGTAVLDADGKLIPTLLPL